MAHAKAYLWYHFVITTKYRRPVINKAVNHFVKHAAEYEADHLHAEIIEWKEGTDLAHIHLIACLPPSLAPAKFMQRVKGYSSRLVRACAADGKLEEAATLLHEESTVELMATMGAHFWAHAYFAKTLGSGTIDAARDYVRQQWEKHTPAAPAMVLA